MDVKFFLLVAVVFSISIYSCKKDSNSTGTVTPLVQKITYNDQTYSTYQYEGTRATKIISSDGSYSTIDYAINTVTVKEYSADNVPGNSEVFTLNSKGYAVSAISTTGKKKSSSPKSVLPMPFAMYSIAATTITYEYDADGHMVKVIYGLGTGQQTTTLTISNGNTVGYSDALGDQTITSTSQFYTDKTNTVGFENMGITFFGKQDLNLIKSNTNSFSGSPVTHTYTYQYDSENRVINTTITTPGYNATNTSYTYK